MNRLMTAEKAKNLKKYLEGVYSHHCLCLQHGMDLLKDEVRLTLTEEELLSLIHLLAREEMA